MAGCGDASEACGGGALDARANGCGIAIGGAAGDTSVVDDGEAAAIAIAGTGAGAGSGATATGSGVSTRGGGG